jgi:hypothetical protein
MKNALRAGGRILLITRTHPESKEDFINEPHPDDPEGIFHHLLLRKKLDIEL